MGKQHDPMELEVIARHYCDWAAQVVGGRLVARELIQISCNHIAAEIQFPVFALGHSKSAARVEFTKNGGIPC